MYPQQGGMPGGAAGAPAAAGMPGMQGMPSPQGAPMMSGGMMQMPQMQQQMMYPGMDMSGMAAMGAGMGAGMGMDMSMMAGGMGMMPGAMGGMGGMPGAAMGMGGGMPGAMGGMGMGGMGGMGAGMMMGAGSGGADYYKTRMCRLWQEGKCHYGPTCKYAHGEGDLRAPGAGGPRPAGMMKPVVKNTAVHKTKLCERFMATGACPYGPKCTFAHGYEDLKTPEQAAAESAGAAAGGYAAAAYGGAAVAGAQDPSFIGPSAPAGGVKRPRVDAAAAGAAGAAAAAAAPAGPSRAHIVPPAHEAMPDERSMDLEALRRRFESFQHDVNAFAADTGHSVAVFTIGGILSDADDTPPEDYAADAVLKSTNTGSQPRLKLAVLKYGSGGVGGQLVARPEIVKFVCARGFKALAEIADAAR